jgi:hypothetical protein
LNLVQFSDPTTGLVAIECVLSSIDCGEQYALFEASAVRSNMSVAFRESPSIRTIFLQIAQLSNALLIAFFDGRCDRALIWPREARTREFDINDFCNESDLLDVDRYGSWLLSEYERLSQAPGPFQAT